MWFAVMLILQNLPIPHFHFFFFFILGNFDPENPRNIIIKLVWPYYEFIARNDGFWRAPEIDFRYETNARKVMVDFKFDALYR